ncbi:hypothetical protein [Verminephrobacter eiseniae]|uniref:hypothetical protein n=1 Tax=Verminephrobacter eiseniae TaxID=364317 RepID=UPI0022383DE7|nr:hypothetical protein [Verminephrobacter eiseniae]
MSDRDRAAPPAEEMKPGLRVTVSGKTTRRRLDPPADPPIPLPSPGLADGRLRILALATVASPVICRSALAIEAQRGVASLANTLGMGCALRSDGCAQPATSVR